MLTLYDDVFSPYARKVRIALYEKGVPFERIRALHGDCNRTDFLHVNPRHHSLALFEHPRRGMHHLMMELYSLDDVGQGYDVARSERDRVKVSLGRHNPDYMISFYMQTPSNFLIEYGWGGREVNVAPRQPVEWTHTPASGATTG